MDSFERIKETDFLLLQAGSLADKIYFEIVENKSDERFNRLYRLHGRAIRRCVRRSNKLGDLSSDFLANLRSLEEKFCPEDLVYPDFSGVLDSERFN